MNESRTQNCANPAHTVGRSALVLPQVLPKLSRSFFSKREPTLLFPSFVLYFSTQCVVFRPIYFLPCRHAPAATFMACFNRRGSAPPGSAPKGVFFLRGVLRTPYDRQSCAFKIHLKIYLKLTLGLKSLRCILRFV